MPTTTYMELALPTVGATVGPDWASDLNAALTVVDSHDHTSGKGQLIPTGAINVNADLSYNTAYGPTDLKYAKFASQSGSLSSSILDALYVNGGELTYNDGNGTAVAITSSGSVAGTPGSITGLTGTAALTWDNTNKVFILTQASSFPAKLQTGDIILYETISSPSNAVTIKSAASLASAYSLTLPAAVPVATALVQMTTGGVLSGVTTLPAGLTIPGFTLSAAPTFNGAAWPSFAATKNNAQTLTSGVSTKIQIDDEEFDTNSNYDNATNYRFTPTVAGKYLVTGSVGIIIGAADTDITITVVIYKNGTAIAESRALPKSLSGSVTPVIPAISTVMDMNGSTDYVELWAVHANAGTTTRSTSTDPAANRFTASRIA